MNSHKFILFCAALMVCSCKKIVTLKLNTAPAQIVIEGEITDQPGPYTVSISQTVGFYEDNTFPPVSGASVTISDNTNGITDSLTEVVPGRVFTAPMTCKGLPAIPIPCR